MRSPFFQNGQSITQKMKSGSSYNNSDIKEDFEAQINTELYILPLAKFIPGLYLSGTIAHSSLYRLPTIIGRQLHDWRIGAEGGIVFNLASKEKDKAALSIIPYFRYNDVGDRLRTTANGIVEERKDFQNRNMSLGLKVAIPIMLPIKTED